MFQMLTLSEEVFRNPLYNIYCKCINNISTSVKSYPKKCVEMKAAGSTGLYDKVFFIRHLYKKVIFDCKFCDVVFVGGD